MKLRFISTYIFSLILTATTRCWIVIAALASGCLYGQAAVLRFVFFYEVVVWMVNVCMLIMREGLLTIAIANLILTIATCELILRTKNQRLILGFSLSETAYMKVITEQAMQDDWEE